MNDLSRPNLLMMAQGMISMVTTATSRTLFLDISHWYVQLSVLLAQPINLALFNRAFVSSADLLNHTTLLFFSYLTPQLYLVTAKAFFTKQRNELTMRTNVSQSNDIEFLF